MANEITRSMTTSASKGGATLPSLGGTSQRDWSGQDYDEGIISTSTTHAALTIKSSLSACGEAYFKNLSTDATNAEYIDIGVDVGGTFYGVVRVYPGKEEAFRFAGNATNAVYVDAGSGTPRLQWRIMEP